MNDTMVDIYVILLRFLHKIQLQNIENIWNLSGFLNTHGIRYEVKVDREEEGEESGVDIFVKL